MIRTLILAGSLLFFNSAWAHEGHDHGTPGSIAAPHGGKLKKTKTLNLELVSSKEGVQVYAFDKEMKIVSPSELQIKGSVKYPKNPKAEQVTFTSENDYFKASVDAKGMHRYSLELNVTRGSVSENVNFNVEFK